MASGRDAASALPAKGPDKSLTKLYVVFYNNKRREEANPEWIWLPVSIKRFVSFILMLLLKEIKSPLLRAVARAGQRFIFGHWMRIDTFF